MAEHPFVKRNVLCSIHSAAAITIAGKLNWLSGRLQNVGIRVRILGRLQKQYASEVHLGECPVAIGKEGGSNPPGGSNANVCFPLSSPSSSHCLLLNTPAKLKWMSHPLRPDRMKVRILPRVQDRQSGGKRKAGMRRACFW